MPHSSGGGSHGGGFHGGSHGGSGRSNHVSTHYFAGARRFRKHHRTTGLDEYVYATSRPQKNGLFSIIVIAVMAAIFFFGVGAGMRPETPKALNGSFDTPAVYDDADLFKNDDQLLGTMKAYYEKTGICSVIYTVYNEQWTDSYSDLESYTFSKYVDNFSDEKHFVIVYSIPGTQASPLRSGEITVPDYSWEAVQGDDTDLLITEAAFRMFGRLVQGELEKGTDPALAFDSAFRYAISDAESRLNPTSPTRVVALLRSLFPMLFIGAIFIPMLVISIKQYIKDKDVEFEEVPLEDDDIKSYQGSTAGGYNHYGSGYASSYSSAVTKVSIVGTVVSLVMLVPFILSGLGMIIAGIAISSNGESSGGMIMLVFGLFWTAIVVFMLVKIIRGLAKKRAEADTTPLTAEYPKVEYPKAEYPKADYPDVDAADPSIDAINPFVPLKDQTEFDPQFFNTPKSDIEDDDEDYKRMKRQGFE